MRPHVDRIAPLLLVLALAGCGGGSDGGSTGADRGGANSSSGLPQGAETVKIDASEYGTRIDNRYWPMRPGSRWVYRETGEEGLVRDVVTVTGRTKRVANGVEARVVEDVATRRGTPLEVTEDWYAQDREGNVWYMGERTAEYEHGRVATREGSWEAGVDGAQPGIALPADPRPGMSYRQEHYAGQAEDRGEVLRLGEQVEVPFGHFDGALVTRDTSPLEPRVVEYKLYAPGIGPALTLDVSGGAGREELVDFTR